MYTLQILTNDSIRHIGKFERRKDAKRYADYHDLYVIRIMNDRAVAEYRPRTILDPIRDFSSELKFDLSQL